MVSGMLFLRTVELRNGDDIDGMVYTRGSRDDWDRYASMTGNEGFTWEHHILPEMLNTDSGNRCSPFVSD